MDQRLAALRSDQAALQGRAAVAQTKLAYQLYVNTFTGLRWDALAARGALRQRAL